MTIRDDALAEKVKTALALDRRICNLPIDVRVSSGHVFVKGKVDKIEQAEVVQFIVKGIHGVHDVDLHEIQVEEKNK